MLKLTYARESNTNTRSSASDDALRLTTPKIMSPEQCLEFIDTDEFLGSDAKSLRIRKKILDPLMRNVHHVSNND